MPFSFFDDSWDYPDDDWDFSEPLPIYDRDPLGLREDLEMAIDDSLDEVELFESFEAIADKLAAHEESIYPRDDMGMRKARIIRQCELDRSGDRGYLDNSWKRRRKTRWRRQKSCFVLSTEMRI